MWTRDNKTPRIVTTPTFDWLAERARECRSRLLVGSAYINDAIVGLTNLVPATASRTLVTRTDLRDFALGASNLDTLCNLARDGTTVRSLSNLHAKIYIFDGSSALVTSANATFAGMYRNFECGLATEDEQVVEGLANSLLKGFGAERPPYRVGVSELESLHVVLRAVKMTLPRPSGISSRDNAPAVEAAFSIADTEMLLEGFRGWLRLTLRGVLAMPESGFRLRDLVDECRSAAAREYPRNRNVEAKLRQQLQVLRDRGIVEFVSPGNYRRTMS